MKKKKYYLHTIDGQPAAFSYGQVCYGYHRMLLASSLRQIRKEQAESYVYRMKRGFKMLGKYGYLVVYVPERRKA